MRKSYERYLSLCLQASNLLSDPVPLLFRIERLEEALPPKMHTESWEKRAAEKRRSTRAKIPQAWLLDEAQLEEAKQQRDLTGPFIQKFLNPEETEIIRKETTELVSLLSNGSLTASQVTSAYCKTAAVAYQIVSISPLPFPFRYPLGTKC